MFHFLQVIIVTKTSAAKMDGREADRAMHDYPDSFRGKVVTFPRPTDQATDLAQPGNPDLWWPRFSPNGRLRRKRRAILRGTSTGEGWSPSPRCQTCTRGWRESPRLNINGFCLTSIHSWFSSCFLLDIMLQYLTISYPRLVYSFSS